MSEQREAIAKTIHTAVKVAGISDVYSLASTRDVYERRVQADAVIAHLWREAMRPEVLETVSRAIESRHYNADGSLRGIAKGYPSAVIATVLTALLGPNPNEEAVS